MGKRTVVAVLSSLALVFALTAVPAAWAEDEDPSQLTGCLSDGQSEKVYVLVVESSGVEIRVTGVDELDSALDQRVTLSGHWSEDDQGGEVFVVVEVEQLGACA